MTKNNLPANVVNPGTQGKKHEEAEKRVVYGGLFLERTSRWRYGKMI